MQETVHILLVDDDPAEELILRALMKKVTSYDIEMQYVDSIDSALGLLAERSDISLVLMDNRLNDGADFRANVPLLRKSGFIGPVGIISSSVDDPYFQTIEEFGADFRLDKAEFDPTAMEFIIREYKIRS